jgi:hypothetical protein
MGNTQGKGKAVSSKKYFDYFLLGFWYLFRLAFFLLVIFMVLFLWTEDFFDYTQWDLPLGLQLLGFVGLMVGMILLFFRPKYSGWVIIASSLFFWIVTFVFRNSYWLGWFFLVFPFSGLLIIILQRIESLSSIITKRGRSR